MPVPVEYSGVQEALRAGARAQAGAKYMPRFVILEHDHPALHWDFMLEAGPVLRTWRLAAPPEPGRAVEATASFDHRPLYLDYEGPISGNRGTVKRWDGGSFSWEYNTPERIAVHLEGACLRGLAVLERAQGERWSLLVRAELERRAERLPP